MLLRNMYLDQKLKKSHLGLLNKGCFGKKNSIQLFLGT